MNVTHTPECIAQREAEAADVAEWYGRWPGSCTRCAAVGGHGYGGSFFDPPGWDDCECVEDGRCPRCGSDGLQWDGDNGVSACYWCAWTDAPSVVREHGPLLFAPTPLDGLCTCYLAAEAAADAAYRAGAL